MCLCDDNERWFRCVAAALSWFKSFNVCFLVDAGEGDTDSGWLRCCIWTPGFQVQPSFLYRKASFVNLSANMLGEGLR